MASTTKWTAVMTTLTFDTLAYARKLKEAGVEAKQAEAQAEP